MNNVHEKGLWKRWEDHYSSIGIDPKEICKDGVINQTKYRECRPKVMFVLREANNFPGGDLRDLLQNGPKYQLWHTIARWAIGILRRFPS